MITQMITGVNIKLARTTKLINLSLIMKGKDTIAISRKIDGSSDFMQEILFSKVIGKVAFWIKHVLYVKQKVSVTKGR